MDYPLENLDPERFQLLCQALIAKEFPNSQCFPVAQPDGGRDTVVLFAVDSAPHHFVIYQVKFVRNWPSGTEPHRWLLKVLEEEAPKTEKLIPKGASRFVLVTNVPGTAHPDVGSIDRAAAILSNSVRVPAQCWWRDDINRRLDSAWDLKWVYSEIMSGPDFLRLIVESGVGEESDRRASTIRAFLRNQYSLDEEVRFKQVELQNRLLDLFVDVPIAVREDGISKRQMGLFMTAAASAVQGQSESEIAPEFIYSEHYIRWHSVEQRVGGASLLLAAHTARVLPHVVVEGAPGQGKSTITQYVCQIHRMKLLEELSELDSVPQQHRMAPRRLPFRVDLRDFATWLGRGNPFCADESGEVPQGWRRSLESFLAALVSYQSGGTSFDVDDLLAILRVSAVLLVFDGLDEVADIEKRKDVVQELTRGIQRLGENCASLQTVVTSRPAAFANSPGMPERMFAYLQLQVLSTELISEYSERWIRARRLDGSLAREFKRVLRTRLDQPHLRDLARNPMQLAILLSLILTRGSSLPDKRTALYDAYVDLFFNRESEKSPVVRDHRDLLIDLHRYLGWTLHAESERGDARASVSADRLQRIVSQYLEHEGYDQDLASRLFTGVVERVVALVSRVEGTFEFEVQPLREYFAACYLFYTAPPSTPGNERPGPRPDRFDALARNFYWLNVTRFFAGCYSKGELPSLVERLQELCRESGYDRISDPRALTATLLADWVFAQNPRSVQQAVELVLEGVGLRRLLADTFRYRASRHLAPLILPKGSGRDQLVAKCFALLDKDLPADFALEVIELLKLNSSSPQERFDAWLERVSVEGGSEARWLRHGLHLGILGTCSLEQLKSIIGVGSRSEFVMLLLLRARRADYLESDESTFDACIDFILRATEPTGVDRRSQSVLEIFAEVTSAARYAVSLQSRQPIPLSSIINRRPGADSSRPDSRSLERVTGFRNCWRIAEVVGLTEEQIQRPAAEWATDIDPWDRIVEAIRTHWGETRAALRLACVAAGIRAQTERCQQFGDLFANELSLCRRARFARLRSGNAMYWAENFERAAESVHALRVAHFGLVWASPSAILASLEAFDRCLQSLSDTDWRWLFYSTRYVRRFGRDESSVRRLAARLNLNSVPIAISTRAACAIADLLPKEMADELYTLVLAERWHDDPIVLEFAQHAALDVEHIGSGEWCPNLRVLRECYARGEVSEPHLIRSRVGSLDQFPIPLAVAQAIADQPLEYPGFLVRLADQRCRQEVAGSIVPLNEAAARGRWFTDRS